MVPGSSIDRRVSFNLSGSRPKIATVAPDLAQEIAHCLPIPDDAPVITRVFPFKVNGDAILMPVNFF